MAALAALAVAAVAAVDAWALRKPVTVARRAPASLSRGVAAPLVVTAGHDTAGRVDLRQPAPPDLTVTPADGADLLEATVTAHRRGHHRLAPVATRAVGPLGLAARYRPAGEEETLVVYPDLVAARRIATAVRRGRFRDPGKRTRGPLGLGTDFESIRDYQPDDDIRRVNWRATARVGRPMSNQYRVEQDRDVVCVVDAGRLMAAPVGAITRVDAAVDAVAAVAAVADVVGDRCGVLAFAGTVTRRLAPRRGGAHAVVQAIFDLEPQPEESDYELAFRSVQRMKRALVLVFTDLLDPAAAASLVAATPIVARKHAVVVATATDPDVERFLAEPPIDPMEVYRMAVALDVEQASRLAAGRIRQAGAEVLSVPPRLLGEACVGAYLAAKRRARL